MTVNQKIPENIGAAFFNLHPNHNDFGKFIIQSVKDQTNWIEELEWKKMN